MEIFQELLSQIPENSAADQTIALRTAGGRALVMENRGILSGSQADEDALLHLLALQPDTAVTHLVCRWNDGCVDLPSLRFRRELLALSPQNHDTLILLQGEHGYVARPLHITVPPRDL